MVGHLPSSRGTETREGYIEGRSGREVEVKEEKVEYSLARSVSVQCGEQIFIAQQIGRFLVALSREEAMEMAAAYNSPIHDQQGRSRSTSSGQIDIDGRPADIVLTFSMASAGSPLPSGTDVQSSPPTPSPSSSVQTSSMYRASSAKRLKRLGLSPTSLRSSAKKGDPDLIPMENSPLLQRRYSQLQAKSANVSQLQGSTVTGSFTRIIPCRSLPSAALTLPTSSSAIHSSSAAAVPRSVSSRLKDGGTTEGSALDNTEKPV